MTTNRPASWATTTRSHAAICNAGHHSDAVPCSCYCHGPRAGEERHDYVPTARRPERCAVCGFGRHHPWHEGGTPSVYVVGTMADGAVIYSQRCPDGIDQALSVIAGQLMHPEEDYAAAYDVLAELWVEACETPEDGAGAPYDRFVASRRGRDVRYGLAVL